MENNPPVTIGAYTLERWRDGVRETITFRQHYKDFQHMSFDTQSCNSSQTFKKMMEEQGWKQEPKPY